MINKVKVSVIIPVYNVELYLKQCLESIMNQTLTDIEIICVDDGSTDTSLEILREYEHKDSRIKVLCQQNNYAGIARNNGMSVATGEYYVFLDSDDFFEPDLLESHYSRMKETGADISICGGDRYNIITSKFETANHYLNVPRIKSLVGNKKVFSVVDVGDMIFSIASPAPWNKMFSAEFVKKHKLQFMGTQRANDSFFILTSMNLAEKITYVDKILVHYRVGMTTNLQANNSTSPFDFCHALQAVKERLEAEGIYKNVEKGFINNVLSQFDYNFSTLETKRPDAYKLLMGKYVDEYVQIFDIADKDEKYFYDKSRFHRVKEKTEWFIKERQVASTPVFEKLAAAYDEINRPKVSVIIPAYNVEEFLPECIESVINQTLKDIEIVCVNDGSPDSSLSIIEAYAEKDNRISVISQRNGGLSAARNIGTRCSRGEYIYYLDSDDYILPQTLEKLYDCSIENDLDILMFGAESFFENNEIKKANMNYVNYYKRENLFSQPVSGDVMFKTLLDKNLFRSSVPLQFFKRDFFLKTGIEFKQGIYHEDELFSALILVQAEKTMCITDEFYMRRVRGDSIMTSDASAKRFEGKFIVYTTLVANVISDSSLSPYAKEALMGQAEKMRASAKRTYKELSVEELNKLGNGLDKEYKFLFTDMAFEPKSPVKDSKELKEIKSSSTYRFSKMLAYIPDKIRGGIQCYKDNGLRYTIYRLIAKIKNLIKR